MQALASLQGREARASEKGQSLGMIGSIRNLATLRTWGTSIWTVCLSGSIGREARTFWLYADGLVRFVQYCFSISTMRRWLPASSRDGALMKP